MLKENKFRHGIDDRPITVEEYQRLQHGEHLYEKIIAPKRPSQEPPKKEYIM